MKIINTSTIDPSRVSPSEREWIYNGLDAAITNEVFDVIHPQLDNQTAATYAFSRALQGPCLEMRLRGVKVDLARRGEVVEEFFLKLDQLERGLDRLVLEGVGLATFSWTSTADLQRLFYNVLRIPPIKKKGRITVDRDALEKMEAYLIALPIVSHIKAMRDIKKKIDFLKTGVDPDGRIRTSYNIAGTDTGRLSSSFTEFGTGGNLQNVEESLRSVLVADDGYKMGYVDAEQGESRVVGAIEWNLFGDGRYIDSCESGDLHTNVAKLCWPKHGWTGDPKVDKELAEQPYYRHYSRRFMCKKIGHGTNYGGKPRTLSNQAKVELSLIEEFQPKYFLAFPAHLMWHGLVERELRETGQLTTLTGRRRYFFGRRDSDETLRAAIAYDPQGSLADIVNQGMLNVWRGVPCQLLMQIHDAIVFQYPEEQEDEIIPQVLNYLRVPIELSHGREFVIPYGCKTGWNWGEFNEKTNPDGLKTYKPRDKRRRSAKGHLLDRVVHRVHI